MDLWSALFLLAMGILAGIVNSAVGSGSLLTLPVLLALGVPPGIAVRTNTIGMCFSAFGAALGFRKEIAAEKGNLGPLSLVTIVSAALGSVLLLISPTSTLDMVVPILIVVALILVIAQPKIVAALNARRARRADTARPSSDNADPASLAPSDTTNTLQQTGPVGAAYRRPELLLPMGAAAVYGGYFTAAQGILYMGILGATTGRDMKAVNPVKNLLSLYVNITAAVVYLIAHFFFGAEILWTAVAILAVGGLLGGFAGSHVAKALPNSVLRGVIVVVALVALVRQFI